MLGSEPPVAMNHNLSVARQGELCACLLIGCSIADVLVVAYPHMGSTHGITKCYPHPSNKSLVEVVDNGVALYVEIVVGRNFVYGISSALLPPW